MNPETRLGKNQTGIAMAPRLSQAMVNGTEELTLPRCPQGNEELIGKNREEYMKEGLIGSLPIPTTAKGVLKTGVQMIEGSDPKLLLDKLGDRLAFERAGVRLYDALISKFEAEEGIVGSVVKREKLEEIRAEELGHFHLIHEVIEKMGADPTAITPSADVSAVASMGWVQVMGEPRIGFAQSLDAILLAELGDNDSWEFLIEVTRNAGLKDITSQFEEALEREKDHLETVRNWIHQLHLGKAAPERGTKKAA